jgi:hypothetical protein
MKKVLIVGGGDRNREIERALTANNYGKPVVVRLGDIIGGQYSTYPVQINPYSANRMAVDKHKMKEKFMYEGFKSMKYYLDVEIRYPFILKSRFDNKCSSSVYLIENGTDYNACRVFMVNGYYIEPIFNYTSEYRLYCTKDEVFYAVKKLKDTDDIITNTENSTNVRMVKDGMVLFPKLWNTIQQNCLQVMKSFGLDIASIDISYRSGDSHTYIINKINPNPPLPSNVLPVFIEQLDKIIKAKL